jgi:hypothetical protein
VSLQGWAQQEQQQQQGSRSPRTVNKGELPDLIKAQQQHTVMGSTAIRTCTTAAHVLAYTKLPLATL